MIKGIYGFNIVVKDLDKAILKYEDIFGVKAKLLEEGNDFAFPGIKGAQLNVNGIKINLLSPTSKESPISGFLEKKGEGLYLISVEVDNIEEEMNALKRKEILFTSEKVLEGKYGKVAFAHPKSLFGVLLEFYQPSKFAKDRWGEG